MNSESRALVWGGALIGALFVLGAGLLCGALWLILPFFYREADLIVVSLVPASLAALGLLWGGALAYESLRALLGKPSSRFQPPPARILVLAFFLVLILGQVVLTMASRQVASYLFPPLHVAASLLPPLAVVFFVGRRLAGHPGSTSTGRTVLSQGAYGSIISPFIALFLETALILIVLAGIGIFIALGPEGWGRDRLAELTQVLRDPAALEDPQRLSQFIFWPPVLLVLGTFYVLIAPISEELVKSLGVPLARARLRSSRDAFLWGVTAGAGFSMVEGLFVAAVPAGEWWLGMLTRWGSTILHALATGIMGLGWWALLAEGKRWRIFLSYGVSTSLHALWNGTVVLVALLGVGGFLQNENPLAVGLLGLLALGALLFLFVLLIVLVAGLVFITRRLGQEK